jgi:putative membrane protein
VCLAFSAFYELVEWWTAERPWEMFCAFVGVMSSPLALGRVHDRQLI